MMGTIAAWYKVIKDGKEILEKVLIVEVHQFPDAMGKALFIDHDGNLREDTIDKFSRCFGD